MYVSQFPLNTVKETPADAEITSHQLMIRAGLIRKIAAGIYTWMPLGLRVMRKVEAIVREEMEKAGAVELLMPSIQPAGLWQESGRWEQYDAELLRLKDRHDNDFCVGPTHEEVIVDVARRELRSYKQLPVNYYQIQTKFRDERRPRFGVMRAREFVMKDAYSFHANAESLSATYDIMFDAYHRIFEQFGLNFKAVAADSGSIGGSKSHEFHVLADSGEDGIAWCKATGYAANVELAPTLPLERGNASANMQEVPTPKKFSCEDVAQFLSVPLETTVKMLVFLNEEQNGIIALCVRGDHSLNEIKAAKVPGIHPDLIPASEDQLKSAFGAGPGSIGPVGFNGKVYADFAAAAASNLVCGANKEQHHLTGVNWGRDCAEPVALDLRDVQAGDPSPDGGDGTLEIVRGIEVGHVFELGTKYTAAMDAQVIGEDGKQAPMYMGCYGLGVTRVVAAAIEQNYDDNGIIWPNAIAPFQVAIVPMNMAKSERVREASLKLHDDLKAAGIDVLLDDRDARPGVKFADIELIGIPHRVVVGDRGLDNGELEYRARTDSDNSMVPADGIVAMLKDKLS